MQRRGVQRCAAVRAIDNIPKQISAVFRKCSTTHHFATGRLVLFMCGFLDSERGEKRTIVTRRFKI